MLGLGYTQGCKNTAYNLFEYNIETSLRSNLVQIETGEGKSITLAVTAIVLALLGIDVYCVCNSELLCERDYLAFKPLFEFLSINENIFYDTFAKICEKTINIQGDLRMILKNKIIKSNKTESKKMMVNQASHGYF
jgi:preprotein translocase subunit SecA